nr:oocyte zinc finger protein XlCOF19-like isoform X2 [Dermacentor andersoni]
MSLAESITAKTACHSPSNVGGQVEVGMQCSLPLADKSVGCSFKAGSKSRSVQTTEAVDQSNSTSGLTNTMSLAESIPAKTACHSLSNVGSQVEVGMQCSLPLADKSVGCSFKAGSESRIVQTTEAVDQLGSTSALRPSISPSTANCDNSKEGCLHQCHLCDYESDELFHLEAHASVHTGEKPFQCPSCHKSLSNRYNLNVHLRTHTSDKPFECPSCSQSFARKYTLKVHLRTHTGEKPYQCPSCSQAFIKRYNLTCHLRTHTGEKPFECSSCSQSFAYKTNLNVHLRTHTGEKPYQCPSCSQCFKSRYDLKCHLRTHR